MRVPSGGKTVREVGEFPLINLIDAAVGTKPPARLRIGIGDDAAVWRPHSGRDLIVTTDMLVQNIHFRLEWLDDWESLGHKALAVNLSDIAAMGGKPRLAFVSLGLSGTERDRDVTDFYRGMERLGKRFGVTVAGGDVTSTQGDVVVSVTVIGETGSDRRTLVRSAAQPGDLIGVTGPLGLAAGGLRVLANQFLSLDGSPIMREAYRRPNPRVQEGRLLLRSGVRAAMDLSDGLLGDLPKMCEASGVSAVIELTKVPIPNALKWGFPDWFDIALRGGEDYELLFTAPPAVFDRVVANFRRVGLRPPRQIGQITKADADGPTIKVREASGLLREVETGAYQHF